MSSEENKFKGKWLEIKGNIQNWGELTNDELDKTKGDIKAIGGLILQKYGHAQDTYGKKLSDIFTQLEAKKDEAVNEIKNKLKE